MHNKHLFKLTLSAVFLGIGLVLPFLTGQIEQFGNMLLPMHLPVLFCGLLCGATYGGAVGFVLPLLRSLLFGMPILYPNALAMAFELCAYAVTIGLLYRLFKKKNIIALLVSLIASLLIGRAVWGVVQTVLLDLSDKPFTLSAFWTSAFATAIPGIILQLVLIPSVMLTLQKFRPAPFAALFETRQ